MSEPQPLKKVNTLRANFKKLLKLPDAVRSLAECRNNIGQHLQLLERRPPRPVALRVALCRLGHQRKELLALNLELHVRLLSCEDELEKSEAGFTPGKGKWIMFSC